MKPRAAAPGGAPRGVTLIEQLMVLGVLAVLTSLTLPSLTALIDRQRLQTAAESLAADLSEARFDAARRGQALHMRIVAGADWCYALGSAPGCDCTRVSACTLKRVDGAQLKGVRLLEGRDTRLDPDGTAPSMAAATFGTAGGDRLRVMLSPMGRAWICSPEARGARYPRC